MTTFPCGLIKPLAGLTSMILSFVALILKFTKEKNFKCRSQCGMFIRYGKLTLFRLLIKYNNL